MRDDMVMRSVYLRPDEDSALRQLAFEIKVTKSDLIRSAISAKLVEWLKGNDPEIIIRDLERGRRLSPAERAERARTEALEVLPEPAAAKPKAAPKSGGAVARASAKKRAAEAAAPVRDAKSKAESGGEAQRIRQPEIAEAGF